MMAEQTEATTNHWVEELFPPAYGVTLEEVLEGKMPDRQRDNDEVPRSKRVSVYNPDSIRNVYEKVRLTMAVGEQLKLQEAKPAVSGKSNAADDSRRGASEGAVEPGLHRTDGPGYDHTPAYPEDLSMSSMWNSEEIDVLRKVYKSAKGEITQLRLRLQETEAKSEQLQNRLGVAEKQLTAKSTSFSEAKKANRRLKIHCDTLKDELGKATNKVDTLQEVLDEVKADRNRCMTELHEVRLTLDKQRMENKMASLDLESQERKFLAEKMLAEDTIKLSYEQTVQDLQSRVEELSMSLEKEKNQHSITRKGLKQLQRHFSSLPYSPGGLPNGVSKDEVKRFQY